MRQSNSLDAEANDIAQAQACSIGDYPLLKARVRHRVATASTFTGTMPISFA
jgi:hypothetical protein